jgi:hypothetical protein
MDQPFFCQSEARKTHRIIKVIERRSVRLWGITLSSLVRECGQEVEMEGAL